MDDNGDRKTPADGLAAEAVRKQSSGSMRAVRAPPRPEPVVEYPPVLRTDGVDGRYAGITPSDSDRPVSIPRAIPELPKELEEKNPRLDRISVEKTWEVAPPELVANSPGLRTIEAYARDAKQLAKRAATRVELFNTKNAGEHADIKIAVADVKTELLDLKTEVVAVKEELPNAANAGRKQALITTSISVAGTIAVVVFGYLVVHEQRLSDQARASTVQIAAPAAAHK